MTVHVVVHQLPYLDHNAWVKHQGHVHEHCVVLGDGKVMEPDSTERHSTNGTPSCQKADARQCMCAYSTLHFVLTVAYPGTTRAAPQASQATDTCML